MSVIQCLYPPTPSRHTDRQSTNDNRNPIISQVWFGLITDGKTDGHARLSGIAALDPDGLYFHSKEIEIN